MKKFLSILLAVLMVLSTVSFAVPNAIGAMDSAADVVEAPVADLAEEAVLSEVDTTSFGKKVLAVNIDDYATFGQYEPVANASILDSTIAPNAMWVESGAAPTLNTEAAGKYITVTKGNGVSAVALRCDIWNTEKKLVTADGIYTFKWDMRAASAFTDANYNMVRVTNNDQGSSVETYITPTQNEDFIGDGQWHTYTATVNSADMWIGSFRIYVNNSGAVDYKNLEVYYKPATATVTLTAGGESLGEITVPTTGVSLHSLQANLDLPITKAVVSAEINGKTYNADDNIVLAGDCDAKLVIADNPNYDAKKGLLALKLDFENAAATTMDTNSPYTNNTLVGRFGAAVYSDCFTAADKLYFKLNNWTAYNAAKIQDVDGDKALYIGANSVGQERAFTIANNDSTAFVANGLYTFEMDIKMSQQIAEPSYGNYKHIRIDTAKDHHITVYDVEVPLDGEWHTYSVTAESTDEYPIAEWTLRQQVDSTLYVDNIKIYYKPTSASVDVVLDGEVVDTQTVSITKGTLVSELVKNVVVDKAYEAAGVKYDGATYGLNDTINFTADSEVEVVLGASTKYSTEYGEAYIYVDFEGGSATVGENFGEYPELKNIFGAAYSDDLKTDGFWMETSSSTTKDLVEEANGNRYVTLKGNANGSPFINVRANYFADPPAYFTAPGVLTFEFKAKLTEADLTTTGNNLLRAVYGSRGGTLAAADVKTLLTTDDEWHTYSVSFETTAEKAINGLQLYQNVTGTMCLDDVKVYYKPLEVNVTFLPGTAVNVEKQTVKVPATGFKASEIGSLIDTSATSKQVVGVKNVVTGKKYGLTDDINVADGAELELIWGESDETAVYGDIGVDLNFDATPDTTTTFGQWPEIKSTFGGTITDKVHYSQTWLETQGTARNVITSGTNKYIQIVNPATANGSPAINFRADYANDGNYITDSGVVTFVFKAMIPEGKGATGGNNFFVPIAKKPDDSKLVEIADRENITLTADGQWHEYIFSFDASSDERPVTGFHLYQNVSDSIYLDDLKVYVKPATATVNVLLDGKKYSFEASTQGLTVAELIAQSGIKLENVYETITAVNYDGVEYGEFDKLTFASDITVTAVKGLSSTLRQDIGKLGLHADFNGLAEGQDGYPEFDVVGGTYSITLPDSVVLNYDFYGAINSNVAESNITTNDLDGSVAFKSSKTSAGWEPSITIYDSDKEGGTKEQIFTTPGYYTLAIDVKVSNNTGAQVKFRFNETSSSAKDKDINITDTNWHTYEASFEGVKSGLAIPQIYVNKAEGTEVSYDNLKVYYKPLTTTVSFVVDGKVVGTKKDVAIEGTTVADLLAGVTLAGYNAPTAIRYAGKEYAADATDALTFAQAEEIVYATAEVRTESKYKPTINTEADVRLGYAENGSDVGEEPRGMRFSATMATAGDTVTQVGWIVTTQDYLEEAGIETENFKRDSNVKKVEGLNIDENGTHKIFANENNVDTFAAVLYGITSENYDITVVARAFVVDDGVVAYSDDVFSDTYRNACQYVYDSATELTDEQKWALEAVIYG